MIWKRKDEDVDGPQGLHLFPKGKEDDRIMMMVLKERMLLVEVTQETAFH